MLRQDRRLLIAVGEVQLSEKKLLGTSATCARAELPERLSANNNIGMCIFFAPNVFLAGLIPSICQLHALIV